MRFTYEQASSQYFATNLRKKDNKLKWDTGNGGMTVIIKGRFGEDVVPQMEKICKKLSTMDTSYTTEMASLAPEVPYVYVQVLDTKQTAQAKARGGFKIQGDVCRYTALACKIRDDECTIYAPGKKQTVEIPAEVQIVYSKVYDRKKTGLFGKKQVEEFAGFFEVSVEGDCASTYQDGAITYTVNDINIPVTREMVETDYFYIKAQEMPSFKSYNEGYNITMREE